jgi:hypothetical protein
MNATTVQDYADALTNGAEFPPVVVFHDGTDHWLADGFHRLLAHEKAGLVDILADVRQGTKRDALLFAVGANASHGLPRTNKDKRRAVEILLRDKEWTKDYDTVLAKMANVSSRFVGNVREELVGAGDIERFNIRQGADGTTRDTSKSGRKAKPAPAEPAPAPSPVQPTRHPLLDELDRAADRDALDRVYSKVAVANLSSDEAEAAGEVDRRRLSELRAKAPAAPVETPTPPPAPPSEPAPKSAPKQADLFADDSVPVSTQAPSSQPAQAVASDEVAALRAENAALCAELKAYREWAALIQKRIDKAPETIKGTVNLDRVRRLVELAGSPSENEARNAAMLACRYIREHQIRLIALNPLASLDPMDRALVDIQNAMLDAGVEP